jgi:hypothetical protein
MIEDGVDSNDVQHVIRESGRIIEHSHPYSFWRYTLEGTSVDGDKIKITVEIDGMLAIVTVVNPKRRMPNDHAQQPGPLGELHIPESEHAAPVGCSVWFGVADL